MVSVRVLVVDDDAAIRELVAAALGDEGYDVATAPDGAAALAAAAAFAPDLIVLDLEHAAGGRPGVRPALRPGGAAPAAGAHPGAQRGPGRGGVRPRRLPAAGFLGKPFDLDDLCTRVAEVVGSRGAP